MQRPPRKAGTTFLSLRQLTVSILQGLMITAGCLGIGYYYMQQGGGETVVRTVIFITLLFSNIFLTLVNRSFFYSVIKTATYKNSLVPIIIGLTLLFMAAFVYVPFVRNLFMLSVLPVSVVAVCIAVAIGGTLWIEVWKLIKRRRVSAPV